MLAVVGNDGWSRRVDGERERRGEAIKASSQARNELTDSDHDGHSPYKVHV